MDMQIVEWIVGGLSTVLLTVCMFILNKVDKNQTILFQLHSGIEHRLTIVETKCDINHEEGGRRINDPPNRIDC